MIGRTKWYNALAIKRDHPNEDIFFYPLGSTTASAAFWTEHDWE